MATADEILESMEDQVEDGVIVIDNDMRTITVPEDIRLLGVESDKEVRRLRFRMPATYGEVDLSEFELRINYLNAAGRGDIYIVKDKETKDGTIEFSWLVGEFATMYKGIVQFIVCAKKINGSVIEKEFNTTRASLPVLEGLEVPQVISEQNPDIIEQILYRLGELEGGGTGGASINDTTPSTTTTYSSVKIDELLNEQKEAIDNKVGTDELNIAVGDALAAAKESGAFDGEPGAPGEPGKAGHTPEKGVDYWTAEDKAGIVSDVLAALPNASGVSF